jgi:hypothetical protein
MSGEQPTFAEVEAVVLGEERCYKCRSPLIVPSPRIPSHAECSNVECQLFWQVRDGWIGCRSYEYLAKMGAELAPPIEAAE